THWQPDDSQEVTRRARDTVRALYGEAAALAQRAKNTGDDARRQKQAQIAAAVLEHAKKSEAGPRGRAPVRLAPLDCPGLPEALDAVPWLLNCLNGTLNLHTGVLHPHRGEDLLTKIIPVTYDPDARCERWEAFLLEIMAGSEELVDFLWKAIGYSLAG